MRDSRMKKRIPGWDFSQGKKLPVQTNFEAKLAVFCIKIHTKRY
jgi:hypothetical protein